MTTVIGPEGPQPANVYCPTPTVGRIVQYVMREQDAEAINRRRQHARDHMDEHRANSNGVQVHVGNEVKAGDVFPLVITRVWGSDPTSAFNGQVLLDGNDLFWATSTHIGTGPGYCMWPPRV